MSKNDLEQGRDSEYPISAVANNEWKSFAKYTVESRAIPNMIDGLKPVQRMVLFSSIQNTPKDFKKVSAVTGVLSDCVVGSTRVLMADGNEVSIADLLGDGEEEIRVIAHDETCDSSTESVGYDIRIANYVQETVVVELTDGRCLECTADHLVAVRGDGHIYYKKVGDLAKDDDLIVVDVST